eukprot:GHVR01073473.1.p1 GENE.GHVR01073473.1~~GHVR01073473.1.p1  ORF type:complete len:144 (+),score=80.44 GHVR01073473.1:103-534(+)
MRVHCPTNHYNEYQNITSRQTNTHTHIHTNTKTHTHDPLHTKYGSVIRSARETPGCLSPVALLPLSSHRQAPPPSRLHSSWDCGVHPSFRGGNIRSYSDAHIHTHTMHTHRSHTHRDDTHVEFTHTPNSRIDTNTHTHTHTRN